MNLVERRGEALAGFLRWLFGIAAAFAVLEAVAALAFGQPWAWPAEALTGPFVAVVVIAERLRSRGRPGAAAETVAYALLAVATVGIWMIPAAGGLLLLCLVLAVAAALPYLSPRHLRVLLVAAIVAAAEVTATAKLRAAAIPTPRAPLVAFLVAANASCVGLIGLMLWQFRMRIARSLGAAQDAEAAARQALEERTDLQRRLLVSDRMASVGTLAAGVAHEINNPLSFVITNLGFLAAELAYLIPPERRDAGWSDLAAALRDAREGAERVRVIVRDLRTFAHDDPMERGPVDLNACLDACANMAASEIRARARLVKRYASGLPAILGNDSRLRQVFLNLIVNAAQAIPEGRASDNEVRLETGVAADGRVFGAVVDTGSGIAPEIRARLFDPFFTTKPVGTGTGLGLSICHNLVSALGGAIEVESEPGRGSTFRVLLPASSPNAHEADLAADAGERESEG